MKASLEEKSLLDLLVVGGETRSELALSRLTSNQIDIFPFLSIFGQRRLRQQLHEEDPLAYLTILEHLILID